jgi:hypothetical protein
MRRERFRAPSRTAMVLDDPTSVRFYIYLPGGSDYTVRVARERPGSQCEVRR